jgi:Dolichyl-phosphate-mannose-protein mannosyltransferase
MGSSSIRASRGLYATACVLAAAYLAIYVGVACARMAYPYELEWFEGTSVDLVRRILSGQSIYVAPSIDFIPHLYAPLYFYVAAVLSRILGVGFLPLRLISFASSLACVAIIFVLVRRETVCARCGLLAAGSFAACYRLSGAWYDIARVDSLSLLFLLASILVLRSRPMLGAAVAAGLLGVLAFFTKQNALPMLAALSLYGLLAARGVARVALPVTLAVGVFLGTALLDHATGRWFSYYVFEIPGQGSLPHGIRWLLRFWLRDFPKILVLAGGSIYWMLSRLKHREIDELVFFGPLFLAAVFSSWSARIHAGGYDNALIMIDAWLAVGGALAMHEIMHSAEPKPRPLALAAGVLAIVQLVLLAYDPRAQVPGRADVAAGDQVVEALRLLPGDVLVAHHPYLAVLAGKRPHGHLDLVHTIPPGTEARQRLDREIDDAIRGRRFDAIVLDRRKDRYYRQRITGDLEDYYQYRGSLVEGNVFWPVTGLATRPQDLYVER